MQQPTELPSAAGLDAQGALVAGGQAALGVRVNHHFEVECRGEDGRLKWMEEFDNIVVTAGLNKYIDATLKTGLASPAWYVGLKDTGTPNAADTMASHASWAEIVPYSDGTRPAFDLSGNSISAGSVSNSNNKAAFTIDGTDDVYGAFIADDATKSGSSGTLLGVGDFAAARSVISGDTLNVQVTTSIAAA